MKAPRWFRRERKRRNYEAHALRKMLMRREQKHVVVAFEQGSAIPVPVPQDAPNTVQA